MKKRVVQILLALLVIIYRKTWFWWIFNHFAGRLVPASVEMEISSLFASCLWSQSSFRYCVFLFNPSNVQSNGFK